MTRVTFRVPNGSPATTVGAPRLTGPHAWDAWNLLSRVASERSVPRDADARRPANFAGWVQMITYARDYPDPLAPAINLIDVFDPFLYVDIKALLAGGLPDAPQPSVLARADGRRARRRA